MIFLKVLTQVQNRTLTSSFGNKLKIREGDFFLCFCVLLLVRLDKVILHRIAPQGWNKSGIYPARVRYKENKYYLLAKYFEGKHQLNYLRDFSGCTPHGCYLSY